MSNLVTVKMCYRNITTDKKHPAETNDEGSTYIYAFHNGSWKWACAEHSGLCHESCWPETLYTMLRKRIKERA